MTLKLTIALCLISAIVTNIVTVKLSHPVIVDRPFEVSTVYHDCGNAVALPPLMHHALNAPEWQQASIPNGDEHMDAANAMKPMKAVITQADKKLPEWNVLQAMDVLYVMDGAVPVPAFPPRPMGGVR